MTSSETPPAENMSAVHEDNSHRAESPQVSEQVSNHGSETSIALSKNAQKRLAKKLKYEAERPERMRKHKERRLAKKEAYKAARLKGEIVHKERKEQIPSTMKVIIDCSFDKLMIDKEIKSMCSQLTRCHAENRSAKHPCEIYLTGLNDRIAHRFHTVFRDQHKNWKNVKVFDSDFIDEASGDIIDTLRKSDLVYLSADSENTIDVIDESKTYIIGGIVDKNRYKNLCQDKASKWNIPTARLPIGEYIDMASRKVLTVNHVFEIMSRWLEVRDWENAFLQVIPRRKLPMNDSENVAEGSSSDEEEHAEETTAANAGRLDQGCQHSTILS